MIRTSLASLPLLWLEWETFIMTRSTKDLALVAGVTAVALLAALTVPTAQAAVVQPCVTAAAQGVIGPAITVLPIYGGGQIYCQSAYGWSDTWFADSQPAVYDQRRDVLSGDNAPDLTYRRPNGALVGSGNQYNFISPWVDGGTLNAQFIGSNWTVVPAGDINVVGNVGTSKITLGGLDANITTTVLASGITETFVFTNNTQETILELLFSDYFNFHANGSLNLTDTACPTTSYDPLTGTVTTVGSFSGACSPIVKNGSMRGSQLPSKWDLDLATTVLADIAAGTYNNALGPVVGDGAIDMVWDLGTLGIGQSVTFTIFKDFELLPEPGTLAVFSLGLAALGWSRRRGASARAV